MAANYREGEFRPAFYGLDNPSNYHGYNYNTLGGTRTGSVDWNDPKSVASFSKLAGQGAEGVRRRLASLSKYPARDYQYGRKSAGRENPYYSQGLGPENYVDKYQSDKARDQLRWYEASQRKFDIRSQELAGIEAAGGQAAYDEQQAAKKLLGKPRAEGARAAELLRQGVRQAGGGGAAPAQAGRQGQRARSAERRRMASNDATVGGGSSPRKRLHAKQLLRQPLGAGTQSAAQVLG